MPGPIVTHPIAASSGMAGLLRRAARALSVAAVACTMESPTGVPSAGGGCGP